MRVPSINSLSLLNVHPESKFLSENQVVAVLSSCKMQVIVENRYNLTLDKLTFCKGKTCYFLKYAKQCYFLKYATQLTQNLVVLRNHKGSIPSMQEFPLFFHP